MDPHDVEEDGMKRSERVLNARFNMIGPELTEWMHRYDWTVEAFALALGVTERTVWRWRRSETAVPPWMPLVLRSLEREALG
jgi:transcriptional regulator with XRE-family HTH domain